MKILFVSSEVVPWSKTGGLADVSAALPAALSERGHRVTILSPLYRNERLLHTGISMTLHQHGRPVTGDLLEAAGGRVRTLFLRQPFYFFRDGIYGNSRGDYPDNASRFGFLSQAASYLARTEEFDLCHLNDWQTGPAAAMLHRSVPTVFTIHNMAYQGIFPASEWDALGLSRTLFRPAGLEFHGLINYLKAGISFAHAVTTVSPRYAEEIMTPEGGVGLHDLLRARRGSVRGILNGIDRKRWNSGTDRLLPANFSADELAGKPICKEALQRLAGFEPNPEAPLLAWISRLVEQKGCNLLETILPRLVVERGVQMVILGSGDPAYEGVFADYASRWPQQVAFYTGFHEDLAHLIEAGADIFLMPSLYEPCGLNQMMSLAYGTIPVVRAVGGLDDTVHDIAEEPSKGNGFKFRPSDPGAFFHAIDRALAARRDPSLWRTLMRRGMREDHSWLRSAIEYEELYRRILR